jgi:hypothetical protein
MSTHMERGSRRVVPLSVLVLAVVAMLAACASQPTTTEAPVQTPPTPKAATDVTPPPPPATAPAAPPPAKATPSPTTAPAAPPPAAAPAKPVSPEGTTYFVHRVQHPGETVSIVAAWYLGDKMRFDVLAAANPEINPKLIKVGMRIRIPENMMKTREPMPKEFVDSFYGRSKGGRPSSPGLAKDQDEEEPQLIGPKESPPK